MMKLLTGQRKDANLGIIIGLLICAIPVYWFFDREPPSQILSNTIINHDHINPGGYAFQKVTVNRFRFCRIFIERRMVDSDNNKIDLPDLNIRRREILGIEKYTQPIVIPKIINPDTNEIIPVEGPAKIILNIEWRCNPVHEFFPIEKHIEMPVIVKH